MGRYSSSSSSGNGELALAGIVLLILCGGYLVKCNAQFSGNRDMIDTEKDYNFYVDYTGQGVSLVVIDEYSDYDGITVEIETQNGLQILTGLDSSQLIKADSYAEAYERALELAGNNPENLMCYDKMMNLNTNVSSEFWNKNIFNLNYQFDYAIIETENGVTLKKVDNWKDWEKDDKVQFKDMNGNVYLGTYHNIKLVNIENCGEEALYQYAVSLAGSEDRVFGDLNKGTSRQKQN